MDIVQEKKDDVEKHWVEKIQSGNRGAFEQLFFEYFQALSAYALQMTGCNERAKDIVQEVFYKIWKRRQSWTVHTSLKAYLFRAVRNEALNRIDYREHRKDVREQFTRHERKRIAKQKNKESEADQRLLKQIWEIVGDMPSRRRSVFTLHRKHGLSYKEIGQVLEISRKTVENHMGLALSDIREKINVDV